MPTRNLVEILVSARNNAGLTQEALAKRLNISTSSIGHYEVLKRKISLDLAERWAEACSRRLYVFLASPESVPEAALSVRDRRHLELLRRLDEGDRRLVEDLARGLHGGKRDLRDMIAAQIPFLLASVPSDEEAKSVSENTGSAPT